MGALGYIAAAAGLALGGVVVWRLTRPAPHADDGLAESLCKKAGLPPAACNVAAAAVGAVVDWWTTPSPIRNNDLLNGEPEVTIEPGANFATAAAASNNTSQPCFRYLAGKRPVVKYKNGCEPIPGKPGWARCKPGTGSLLNPLWPGARDADEILSGERYDASTSTGDPFTRPAGPAGSTPKNWPASVPVPPGHTPWWVMGQARTCPPGTAIRPRVRDHRGGEPVCEPIDTGPPVPPPPPLPTTYAAGASAGHAINCSTMPGYYFDAATGTCRRRAA